MDSVLHQLYSGDLCPHDDVIKTRNASGQDEFVHKKAYFSQLLREQAPALTAKFNVLMDDLTLAYYEDTEDAFCQGFGLAVKLFTEGLSC